MSSPRIVVVDSSVVVKWFSSERESDVERALELREAHHDGTVRLAAPSLLVFEVLNALKSRDYTPEDLGLAAGRLLGHHLELAPLESLAARAAVVAVEHGLTVYDAAFVALAESLDAELVTADHRLAACTACRTRLLGEM